MSESFRATVERLEGAQKGAARSAPAYSRFINRRLGRYLAAAAVRQGLSPNQVTAMSAAFTFTGVVLVAALAPSLRLGVVVGLCFIVGYALDSADGQVARLTGTGGPAGEWLDHMVDATKVSGQPLALLIGFWRFDVAPHWWLIIPLVNAIVGAVFFFGMMLTEQLRRAEGVVSRAATTGRAPWLRPLLVLPTDYGVLCLTFLLLGSTKVFMTVYTFLTLATAGFLLLACVKWFRELGELNTDRTHVPGLRLTGDEDQS